LPSGAYIFKPKTEDQEAHPYSSLASYSVQNGAVAAALIFDFEKAVENGDRESYQV